MSLLMNPVSPFHSRCEKLSKQSRASFVQQDLYSELRTQELDHNQRIDAVSDGVKSMYHTTELDLDAPALARASLPGGVVMTTVRTSGVRNTALPNSSLPLALTTTTSGYFDLCSTLVFHERDGLRAVRLIIFVPLTTRKKGRHGGRPSLK